VNGTSKRNRQQPDQSEIIEILPGILVPEKISRGYGFTDAGGGYIGVDLEVVDGTPCLRCFEIRLAEPVPLDRLLTTEVQRSGWSLAGLSNIARDVFADQVQSTFMSAAGADMTSGALEDFGLERRPGWKIVDQADYDQLRERAREATVKRGGRPPTPNEKKLAIYEAWKNHGIAGAMEVSGVGERQTRKHIAAAKELRKQAG
jgi:hypothetical protein